MKKALTIGELLIAMTIIGAIAMLVLPGFLRDYHQRLYATKLKKTCETIEIAIAQACNDDNVSYFNQTQYAKNGLLAVHSQQEFLNKYFKLSTRGNVYPFMATYKALSSPDDVPVLLVNSAWAKLVTGEAISFSCGQRSCTFRIDINSDDGPNIGGRDFFTISLNQYTNELYDANNENVCRTSATGEGCYAHLLNHNWEMSY